jgi:hypothetical protein
MAIRHESAGISAQVSDSTAQTGLPCLPMRAGDLPVAELIDLYMAHYAGRDPTRVQRLGWWSAQLGHVRLQDLSDGSLVPFRRGTEWQFFVRHLHSVRSWARTPRAEAV